MIDKKFLPSLLILLCLIVPLVIALLTTYHMSAPIASESVKLYSDEACTLLIDPSAYTFTDTVSNGTVLSVWAKNTGNIDVTVTLTLTSNASCIVTLDPDSFGLVVNAIQRINMTFSGVSGTTASWEFSLEATKIP